MEDQKNIEKKGGTMRLGAYECRLRKDSKTYQAYNVSLINERHRHRYEYNNVYLDMMEANGMSAIGVNPVSDLVEIIELQDHPWFVGVQFHPELKSTVEKPHPLFVAFVKACIENQHK